MKKSNYGPVTHLGWYQFYVRRFNRNLHPDAAELAMTFAFLYLRDGGDPSEI